MRYYKLSCKNDKCFVFSTSYHNPTEQMRLIEKDLSKKNFKGVVIFDLLLSNGNLGQRFFKANFDNGLSNAVFEKIDIVGDDIKDESLKFYSKHIDLIQNSDILSAPAKFLIKKGIAI